MYYWARLNFPISEPRRPKGIPRRMLRRFSSLLTISGLCLLPSLAGASTILSENFDELTAHLSATSVGAFKAIDGTNVDIVGPGDGFGALCATPESGNCIDLDGSYGNPQGVLQSGSITLDPGVNYYLSFDLVGSQRGATTGATVNFGSYSQTFVLSSSDDTDGIVTNELVTVGAVTLTNLTFTSNTPGDIGSVLDDVSITSSPSGVSPVPEPSSILLTGSALLLSIGLLLRRRRMTPAPAVRF
jgi:hypothetical protein